MLLVHIITSFALVLLSITSIAVPAKNHNQKLILIGLVTSTIVSFVSGIALILQGGAVARLCIFGGAAIVVAILTSRRVLVANNIRIEL